MSRRRAGVGSTGGLLRSIQAHARELRKDPALGEAERLLASDQRMIRLLAIDPALRNVGLALLRVDPETLEIEVEALELVKTENEAGKRVRKNSDDLRRAGEAYRKMRAFAEQADLIAAEIPSGTQSARGAMSNGISIGLLAALREVRPLIEVSAAEAKKIATGRKTATKEEMIAWATARHPNAPWKRARGKAGGALVADNEHLADACAIGQAALATPEFRAAIAVMRSVERSH